MAACPRCHRKNNENVANLVCKLCYRDLVFGTRTAKIQVDLTVEDESLVGDAVNS